MWKLTAVYRVIDNSKKRKKKRGSVSSKEESKEQNWRIPPSNSHAHRGTQDYKHIHTHGSTHVHAVKRMGNMALLFSFILSNVIV